MQPLIEAYPSTRIVLLHSSYPYTREAGYLTAMYDNVFLDFGEIFPFVSPDGQREVLRQALELAPTNKIMWSSMSRASVCCLSRLTDVHSGRSFLARVLLPWSTPGPTSYL